MVTVIVLPLAQLVVEQVNLVADAALVQQPVELLIIDACERSTLPLTCGVRGRMYAWRMSRRSRCQ